MPTAPIRSIRPSLAPPASAASTHTADLNGAQPEGVGYYAFNIRKGWRDSTVNACLRPVLHRANLDIRLQAQVNRILFAERDTARPLRAIGVEYLKTAVITGSQRGWA
ncbi:MAG: GMC family oxidoreductase N-terminal domain-containing protein [Thiolinea sp.]